MKRTFVVTLEDTGQGDPARRLHNLVNSVSEFLVTKVTEIPTENSGPGWLEAMAASVDIDASANRPSDLELDIDSDVLSWLARGGPYPIGRTAN